MKISEKQLVRKVAKNSGNSIMSTEKIINVLKKEITEYLKDDHKVSLKGFGTFESRMTKQKIGFNPKDTRHQIIVPPIKLAKFKTGYRLKKELRKE